MSENVTNTEHPFTLEELERIKGLVIADMSQVEIDQGADKVGADLEYQVLKTILQKLEVLIDQAALGRHPEEVE